MSESSDSETAVLIVEDEHELADLYQAWLATDYDVRTANSGEEGLDLYDSSVDVVLLDRRMPDMSGDEVLEAIREQAHSCQVVMVTAVTPDFDILDMGFDSYVTKPVDREDLTSAVEQMLTRREYDQTLQTYYQLTSKRSAIMAEKSAEELAEHDEFAELERRIDSLESEVDRQLDGFDDSDFEAAFRRLDDH